MVSWRKRFFFFGSLGLCALLLFGLLAIKSSILLLSQIYPAPALAAPSPQILQSPITLAHGEHLVRRVLGCTGCHGTDLRGGKSAEASELAEVRSADLIGIRRSVANLQNVLAYGVDSEQRALWLMPSGSTSQLSEADRHAVVGFLRQAAAAGKEPGPAAGAQSATKALTARGRLQLLLRRLHVHEADQAQQGPPIAERGPIPSAPTAEYGAYLAGIARCTSCHRGVAELTSPPLHPMRMQLLGQHAGALSRSSYETFLEAFQAAGRRPELGWHGAYALRELEMRSVWSAVAQNEPAVAK
jgi:cytochrome c553